MKIRVFQIDHEKDEKNLAFRDYQTALAKNGRIDESIYKQVYGGEVPCRTLEEVYTSYLRAALERAVYHVQHQEQEEDEDLDEDFEETDDFQMTFE